MSPHTTTDEPLILTAIAVVKTLVLLAGGLVTYYSYKAYRRTEQRSLGFLAAGFGVITVGVALAGLLSDVIGLGIGLAILVESVFVFVGLLLIAYSLRAR